MLLSPDSCLGCADIMGRLLVTALPNQYLRSLLAMLLALVAVLLAAFPALAQSNASDNHATLQGSVRDSNGSPVAGAAIYFQAKDASPILVTHTEADGTFRCSALRAGVYTLRSDAGGFNQASFGPFSLGPKEIKKIDLTLVAAKSSPAHGATETPQFYDEPQFTVAGVTDTTNLGGHGSTATVRNTESLTRGITSLSKAVATPSAKVAPPAISEESLRAAAHAPDSFDANYALGAMLLASGKPREATSNLERASKLNPGDYENSLALARAYAASGSYERSRSTLRAMLDQHDRAEPHHLLADVDEKLNDPLEAVRQYQRAAEIDPSESNLFDWGAELLIHHASEPAAQVFAKGAHLYPTSTRMLIGLGISWNARGASDKAAQYLCDASDLNPNDPDPYLFLGRLQHAWNAPSEASSERLARFARLQPDNALANYYYAVSLWKRRKGADDTSTWAKSESLLQRAIGFDPKLGLAHLQLGILYSERKDYPKAIAAYQKAIDVSPALDESHYRLAQAYRQVGESSKAQQEIELYDQLSKKNAEDLERERREMPQFVYTLRNPPPAAPALSTPNAPPAPPQ